MKEIFLKGDDKFIAQVKIEERSAKAKWESEEEVTMMNVYTHQMQISVNQIAYCVLIKETN